MNLSELIRTWKGARTYKDLSAVTGGSPTWKSYEKWVNDPIRNFPDPPTMQAIARALGVEEETVMDACAESLGLRVNRSGRSLLVSMLAGVPGTERLTDEEIRTFLALIRLQVAAKRPPHPG